MPLDHASNLVKLLSCFGAPFGVERSVKISSRKLLSDRILLSIHKDALGSNPLSELLQLLKVLKCPEQACTLIREYLENAEIIHLGYEVDGPTLLYKCYLEFPGEFRLAQLQRVNHEAVLVHVACKWEPVDNGLLAVSYYHGFIGVGCMEILGMIQERIYNGLAGSIVLDALYDISRGITEPVVDDVMLMEVTEPENDRLSFDLNIYNWEIKIADIRPQIDRILTFFDIPSDVSSQYLYAHNNEITGHVSGGYDRSGNEFFTLYHGVEEYVP